MERYYFVNRLVSSGRKVPVMRNGERLFLKDELDAAVARAYRLGHAIEIRPSAVKYVAPAPPMREVALAEAMKLVGVMEEGGNNRGLEVMRIITANGGTGPEPWCGDFVAYAYRSAGSVSVTRSWAAVRYLGYLTGMSVHGAREGRPGDILTFTFDHTGLIVHYCDWAGNKVDAAVATHVKTVEGNTGAAGAVSDSQTGGDGVYVKVRPLSQVARTVRVHR